VQIAVDLPAPPLQLLLVQTAVDVPATPPSVTTLCSYAACTGN